MASEDESRGLVAVTGANGTIGYQCVLYAVRTGYRVRCILRRENAISTFKRAESLQHFQDRLEFAIVPDNTVPRAYDEILRGVQYVIHIAGVWPMPHYHPDNDIYYPFVRSMENILSAAERSGTVRRIVFTQAGAGLVSTDDGELGIKMDKVLNEYAKVNDYSADLRPPLPSPHHAYTSAKAYCMRHLLSLKNSDNLPFSIVQVIPGTVIGQPYELTPTAEEVYNRMDRMCRAILFNEPKPRYLFGFVHFLDVAKVHVEALDEVKVPREKIPDFFIAASSTPEGKDAARIWREACEMVDEEWYPEVRDGIFKVGWERLPENIPFRVDSGLTERMLFDDAKGFVDFEGCLKEVVTWYLKLKGPPSIREWTR
ncbi:3-beta hydroxysteroid dehydrogenase/isomerase family protein [Delitschia confertaspora ATCC 74209]|uniref:3-beta hydroxysteroid dehydrogenase/isomerase family protein n=1 Tax=Delitschia confertaspora ATCC 74209 TaxID=1513339 RepID=A0A9P4MT78_9PLEO|nr:3-beta hydroxysteroid dehydrogenase/isomerase family protein [Delitschia confertaspora ATCC 74209]